ncbi:MAG TPA: hypothetical protein PLX59_06845 [Candidatus Cloacimonadota bacterium]|nr:hypothetical protein [Candidatus Cloacimonadota bacterium]
MKAVFKNMLMGYSGSCDGIIYYYSPKHRVIIARRRSTRRSSSQDRLAAVARQLRALQISEAYKEDLRRYAAQYKLERNDYSLNTWTNVMNKLFWALAREYSLDLRYLSREDIFREDYPVKTVKEAVEAGLLPRVKGFEALLSGI